MKIGTAEISMEAFIACVNFKPAKKRIKFMFVPKSVAVTKGFISAFSIFKSLKAKGRNMMAAIIWRMKPSEKIGTSVRVSFMIGAVAPQIIVAVISKINAGLAFRI